MTNQNQNCPTNDIEPLGGAGADTDEHNAGADARPQQKVGAAGHSLTAGLFRGHLTAALRQSLLPGR